jgi:hypothetical protein
MIYCSSSLGQYRRAQEKFLQAMDRASSEHFQGYFLSIDHIEIQRPFFGLWESIKDEHGASSSV